jgi:hypothetical protein
MTMAWNVYRRIGMGGLLLMVLAAAEGMAQEEGFVSLFNGRDLTGWRGDKAYWSVRDGAITGQTTAEQPLRYNTFLIWEGGQPANFELKLSFRIVGGNSGVQYRSQVLDEARFIVGGYQADIDAANRYTGMCYEERGRGFLAPRGQKVTIAADGQKTSEMLADPAELQTKIRSDDWNEYRIVARGPQLQHYINGVLMAELVDHQTGKAASKGVLALQLHQGPPMTVQFKDLRLKELP